MKQYMLFFSMFSGVVLFSGCSETPSQNSEIESTTTSKANTSESLSTAAHEAEYISPLPDSAPVLKVGVILNSPYHYKNEFGTSIGYDVDLIRAIGVEEGFKVQFNQMNFSELFASIEKGTIDITLSGLSLTPERQELYATSLPYSKGKPGYMVLADAEYQTKESLDDKPIGVIGGANLTKILAENTNAEVLEKPTLYLAFETVLTGKSNGAFGMEPNLRHEAKQFSEMEFNFVPFSEDIYTAIYAKKDNQALIEQINKGFEEIKLNGEYNRINEKWFGDSREFMVN